MAVYADIVYRKQNGISTITLNRPAKLNALDYVALQEMIKVLDEAREDDSVKALIITGAGRAFCAGADITSPYNGSDFRQPGINRTSMLEPLVSFGAMVKRLKSFHKPAIAAVNGIAAGAGLSIACLCDIRIASEDAGFCSVFVRRALIGDCGLTYTMPRIVGLAKTLELMWSGDIIDAKEAERIGLVSRVVPAGELIARTEEMAARIARGPSISIELAKKAVYDGLEANNFSSQLAYETWANLVCSSTADFKEAIDAFINKRPADFSGK